MTNKDFGVLQEIVDAVKAREGDNGLAYACATGTLHGAFLGTLIRLSVTHPEVYEEEIQSLMKILESVNAKKWND